MTVVTDSGFDFSGIEPPVREDIVVREWLSDDIWIETLITAGGNETVWNWSPTIAAAEEARTLWQKIRS